MFNIAVIINPIAGMGGKVGLKGTDHKYEQAVKLGSEPIASKRAEEFFQQLLIQLTSEQQRQVCFIVPPGVMGENVLCKYPFQYKTLPITIKWPTTANDTIKAVTLIIKDYDIKLIIFAGGDGTSVDIHNIIQKTIPILGIPSGVKMYGGVFAQTPLEAAKILSQFLSFFSTQEGEIMDIDEYAYQNGRLSASLKGIALIPSANQGMQLSKHGSSINDSEISCQEAIAQFIIDNFLELDIYYLLGPGGTVKKITDLLGLPKTPLGVDILQNSQIIATDVNESTILKTIQGKKTKIIITPLGHQGSLFGRGNQQLSGKVIQNVGRQNIIVIATKNKLSSIEGTNRALYVDTQDTMVDDMLRGYMRVITDYDEFMIVKII